MDKNKRTELINNLCKFTTRILNEGATSDKELEILPKVVEILLNEGITPL